jgi:hypothetical protein
MAVSPTMSVRNQLFPPPPTFHPPMFHEESVFTCQTPSDHYFVQWYGVYAQCNHSVAENAPQTSHNPSSGSFDSDQCWGCADLYPSYCFHQLGV